MIKKLPILTVLRLANQFDRYVIEDERHRSWNGQRFGNQNPALYANHNEACLDSQNILRSNFKGIEPVKYVVPVFVEVYSHEPVSELDVARYLSASSILQIDTSIHGNGPQNSLVLPLIDWRRIERLDSNVQESTTEDFS